MARRRAIAGVVCALVAGGCGGPSEEEKAGEALKAYWAAIADRDGSRACELLSEAQRLDYDSAGALGCARLVLSIADGTGGDPGQARRLARTNFEVTITGDRAEANERSAGCFELVREDGEWRPTNRGC